LLDPARRGTAYLALMSDAADARRQFIEDNALDVKNLDI
jgi:DNA gyrase/topoisomerase IV subunit B